jgi:hypothetical protein
MNWPRGLFRLWLVLSAAFLLALGSALVWAFRGFR